jgi:raffinose synthase
MDIFCLPKTDTLNDTVPETDGGVVPLIAGLPPNTEIVPAESGIFLRFRWEKPTDRMVLPLGEWNIKRWTACHRYEPFWMKPCAGEQVGAVPIETQFLLCEMEDDHCLLCVPLIDGNLRASVQGGGGNRLELVIESGDPAVVGNDGVFLYLAAAEDYAQLVSYAADDVKKHLNIRRASSSFLPHYLTGLGWCTWDAFYQDVSHDKVREGLESFKAGGIVPFYLILDDGWQSVNTMPSGERRLTAFAANDKFPNDLAPTVQMAKQEFGVETFLVWHALHGYWGGVDGGSLPGYDVQSRERRFSSGILHHVPTIADWWGKVQGVVSPRHIYRFFHDYHRHLRAQGVDGVKVDNQAAVEGTAHGLGGRVALMRAYHEALEGSVSVHFGGKLINCMSCASEMIYSMSRPDIIRTSTDFWPNRPESHGLHLYTNAQVSLWFGQFGKPDWDMFQSGHEAGTYHAVGRVVGGSPIYVSDKPGEQNFDLLRKLVLPSGQVLVPSSCGVPTRDCLFHDPTREDVLLKIRNDAITDFVVGVFNARYNPDAPDAPVVRGEVTTRDTTYENCGKYIVYAHFAQELRVMTDQDAWEIELPPLGCELFAFHHMPDEDEVPCVALGDTRMFHCMGNVDFPETVGDNNSAIRYETMWGEWEQFAAWCGKCPSAVTISLHDEPLELDWTFDETTGRLDVHERLESGSDSKGFNRIIIEF